jgi:cell wall assembly regulator SMI1
MEVVMRSNFKDIQLDFDNDYSFNPVCDSEIDIVETLLNQRFPKDLRDFYIKFNGAQFAEKNCCIEQVSGFQKIHTMAELNATNKDFDFIELYKATLNPYWPNQLIPFAYDEAGHEFCFSCSQVNSGKIYFHNSELTGEPEETQFIAKDFLSFLEALRPESDFE